MFSVVMTSLMVLMILILFNPVVCFITMNINEDSYVASFQTFNNPRSQELLNDLDYFKLCLKDIHYSTKDFVMPR